MDLLDIGQGESQKIKKSHKYNYEQNFSKEIITQRYKGTKDENMDSGKLRELPTGFEHKIDFTSYNVRSVYNWSIEY